MRQLGLGNTLLRPNWVFGSHKDQSDVACQITRPPVTQRVRRTKRAIRDALLRLIQEKPVTRVTTTELCAEADINRNTFYAHCATPEDVLAEVEKEFLEDLALLLEDTYEEGKATLSMCKA